MAETARNSAGDTLSQVRKALVEEVLDPKLQIERLVSDDRYVCVLKTIGQGDRDRLIGRFHHTYGAASAEDTTFLKLLGRLCSIIGQLPASVMLSTGLEKDGGIAVAPGGLMDTWKGDYQGVPVAIKAFRAYATHHSEEKQILWELIPMYKKLIHPNVAAFRGATTTLFPLALVYDWGEEDTILKYVQTHSEAQPLTLLLQAAKGLQYLHSHDIPHGALKVSNVVIDGYGQARLTDYGLALIINNPDLTVASPSARNLDSTWLAPEIVHSSNSKDMDLKPADIFSFAMLVYVVLTGGTVFPDCAPLTAGSRIRAGEKPDFPPNAGDIGLTLPIRQLLEMCWDIDPTRRPTIVDVVRVFEDPFGTTELAQTTPDDRDRAEPVPDVDDSLHELQTMPLLTGTGTRPPVPDARPAKKWWRRWFCMGG